jgi:hypothetical protein
MPNKAAVLRGVRKVMTLVSKVIPYNPERAGNGENIVEREGININDAAIWQHCQRGRETQKHIVIHTFGSVGVSGCPWAARMSRKVSVIFPWMFPDVCNPNGKT